MSAIDLKQLWQQHHADAPNVNEIITTASGFNRKCRRRILAGNLLLSATMMFIIWVIWYFDPQLWTTKIGALVVLSAILLAIFQSFHMFALARPFAPTLDVVQAIDRMRRFRQKQHFVQTTVMSAYFLLLGSGLVLYSMEYAMKMNATLAVIFYSATALWIGFNWFYIRVKTIKKQRANVDSVLASLESIASQFESDTNSDSA